MLGRGTTGGGIGTGTIPNLTLTYKRAHPWRPKRRLTGLPCDVAFRFGAQSVRQRTDGPKAGRYAHDAFILADFGASRTLRHSATHFILSRCHSGIGSGKRNVN